MNSQTALQVTDFNFYGDNLIAFKDNATCEIYTAINSVLRGIGFIDKDQIRKRRDKWINDPVISKGVVKFNIPIQEVVAKNDTTLLDKETYCISQHKLPIADVIERDTTLRSLFEDMVDNLLERYNLAENNINVYQETIFKGDDN